MHDGRDPVPSYILKTEFPIVAQYCDRMQQASRYQYEAENRITSIAVSDSKTIEFTRNPKSSLAPAFFPNDTVPPTLLALLNPFCDLVGHIEQSQQFALEYAKKKGLISHGTPIELPRRIGFAKFSIRGEIMPIKRMAQSFSLFMWKRLWDQIESPMDTSSPTRELLDNLFKNRPSGTQASAAIENVLNAYQIAQNYILVDRNPSNQVTITISPSSKL
jgi:hypothetical protein